MKKSYLLLLILFFAATSHAQIKFETSSLQNIILKAKKENKLIFLQIDAPADCKMCNEIADKAFERPELNILKNNFVFLKISSSHPDRKSIDELYNTTNFAGTLFLNNDGILIYRYNGSTTRPDTYIEQGNIAIEKSKSNDNILSFQKLYESAKNNTDALEKYIFKRNELKLPIDSLLDQYALLIPADSLKSFRVLQFIAANAPLINSTADSILRHDFDMFNQAWYRLSLMQRININHSIVVKSQKKAIETRNINYAYRVSGFAGSVNNSNPNSAAKISQQVLLDYYKGVNDTVNYIRRAIPFYDRFLMTISVNDIKKADSLRTRELLKKTPSDTVNLGEGIVNIQKKIAYAPLTQSFARELNNAAWSLYNMSSDTTILKKALQWCKRAIEFFETPDVLDTYARLLYTTGSKQEAIEMQNKVIDLQKKRGFNSAEFERVLKRMKSNATFIDDKGIILKNGW